MITRPGLMDLFHPVDFFLPIWLFLPSFLPSFLPQTHRSRRSFQILSDYCFTALASRAATRGVKDGPMRFIRRLKLGERGALERELFSCVETRRERERFSLHFISFSPSKSLHWMCLAEWRRRRATGGWAPSFQNDSNLMDRLTSPSRTDCIKVFIYF